VTESMLVKLENRVRASIESEDVLRVLDDVTVNDAGELWRAVLDASASHSISFDLIYVIASLHWHRYNSLPAGRDHDDLQVAAVMFALVQRAEPNLVPEPLREMISNAGYLDFTDNVGIPPWGPSYSEDQYPSSREISISDRPESLRQRAILIMQETRPGDNTVLLHEAIDLMRQAVGISPMVFSERASCMSSLSRALLIRFEQLKDCADIDEAVTLGRGAVRLAAPDDFNLPGFLLNLGSSLGSRFLDSENIADLDEAIVMFRRAVGCAPDGHPHRTTIIKNLERALVSRFDRLGNRSDVLEAMSISDDVASD
jgi:hypothetical protein